MVEQAHAGKGHDHFVFIRGVNDVIVGDFRC